MVEGFLLGFSSGAVCLVHCAPVIVPFFLGEGENTWKNTLSLTVFLLGRLAGYILFGVVAWSVGQIILTSPEYREIFFGIIYVILSLAMAFYGLFISKEMCAAKSLKGAINRLVAKKIWIVTAVLGLLTGINFCPPFLLAFSSSAYRSSLFQSVFFFFMFFLGTALYFIPLVFIGFLKSYSKLKIIGKMAAVVMSVYFCYRGVLMIIGGIKAL